MGILVMNYLQFIWFLKYKKFITPHQTTILTILLSLQLPLYLVFNVPFVLLVVFTILQPIFIVRSLKKWLPMVLFLYVENSLTIISWLFTNDLIGFLLKNGQISNTFYQQILPVSVVLQQLLLFILILIAIKIDQKYSIFDSINQVQKSYKLPAILLTILLIFLDSFKRLSVFFHSSIDFFYLTFLLLTLSIIFCTTAYLYSQYYQQQMMKKILYQQYNKEMEKITLSDEFRHDYHNILLSLMGYIENNELQKALGFISSVENYSKNLLEEDEYDQVNHLTIPPVQGLLIHFIEMCESQNIQLTISIPQIIHESDISIQLIDFIRCISTLFDYALKTNVDGQTSTLTLSIKKENQVFYFHLTNLENSSELLETTFNQSTHPKKKLIESNLIAAQKILQHYKETEFSITSNKEKFTLTFSFPIIP